MSREIPWRTLVRELADAGYDSPYLDRLRQRVDPAHAHRALETEIIGEMAAALGRAEDKVNSALLRLELAHRDLETATPEERSRHAAAFDARREEALAARWELVVHRESVGFAHNEIIERLYPIPPRDKRTRSS